jgi:hypothetical protein
LDAMMIGARQIETRVERMWQDEMSSAIPRSETIEGAPAIASSRPARDARRSSR